MKPLGWTMQDQTETEPQLQHLGQLFSSWQNQQPPAVHLNNWRSFILQSWRWKLTGSYRIFLSKFFFFLQVSIGFYIAICQFKQSSLIRSGIFHFLPQADTSCARVTHVVRRWWRLGDCRLINSTQMHTDKDLHTLSYTTTSLFLA